MRGKEVKRFTLYGEDGRTIGPEFVHIERIADRSSLHDWTIAPHSHPGMAQVLMIETGTVDVASDGSARKISAPACIIVPGGCVHAFRFAVAAEGWVLSMAIALLHDPRIAGLLEGLGLDGGGLRMIPLETEDRQRVRLSWLLADMADRLEQGLRATPALIAQLGLVLATLGETLAASLPQDAGKDRRAVLVARYRGMIEAQYRYHWPVDRYARAGCHLIDPDASVQGCRGQVPGRSPARSPGIGSDALSGLYRHGHGADRGSSGLRRSRLFRPVLQESHWPDGQRLPRAKGVGRAGTVMEWHGMSVKRDRGPPVAFPGKPPKPAEGQGHRDARKCRRAAPGSRSAPAGRAAG